MGTTCCWNRSELSVSCPYPSTRYLLGTSHSHVMQSREVGPQGPETQVCFSPSQ